MTLGDCLWWDPNLILSLFLDHHEGTDLLFHMLHTTTGSPKSRSNNYGLRTYGTMRQNTTLFLLTVYLSQLSGLSTESWLTQIHSYCSFLDAIQFYMYYPQNLTYFSWIWKKLYNFTYTFPLVCLNTISSKAHYHRACQMWAFMLAIKALSILWDPFYLLKLVFHCFWKYSFSPISIKVPFPI